MILGKNAHIQNQEAFGKVFKNIVSGVDDLVIILTFVFVANAAMKYIWQSQNWVKHKVETALGKKRSKDNFDKSLVKELQPAVKNLGLGLLFLWVIDAAYIAVTGLGMVKDKQGNLVKAITTLVYTVISGSFLNVAKNRLIGKYIGFKQRQADATPSKDDDLLVAKTSFILRRGSNILMWAVLGFNCADRISNLLGVKLTTILSFAGVGGLALGLAVKDMASNLVGGCIVFLTQPFVEGDKIETKDLKASKVKRIGFYQTTVLGDDEKVRTIPNSKFVSNSVSNKSRRTHRCLAQSVYLTYETLPFVEEIIKEFKEELIKIPTCDTRTRSVTVGLKELGETAIEVEVEAHFEGSSTNFREKRQQALLLLAKKVREKGGDFAILDGIMKKAK